jgi:hypothetical protein
VSRCPAGSVNKLLPIPGLTDYAHGFRSISEAAYLGDQIIRQLELAAVATDPEERAARCTFVVVGAGYTGTEVAAHGQLLTTRLARLLPGQAGQEIRWMLLDTAPRVLPELDPRPSRTAKRVLCRRGVEVWTGESIAEAGDGYVKLTTGVTVATRSLIWCVGVRADPLVDGLQLATNRGRLQVDEYMAVPGTPDIYACGDCAAVPDLTRPGQICGMAAQHAQRQGKLVARNVTASLGEGTTRPYQHHDLGFLVDLGGLAAAANPLHISLVGRQRRHPRISPVLHVRQPAAGAGRLDPERGHIPGTDVPGGDQRAVRPARRESATTLIFKCAPFSSTSRVVSDSLTKAKRAFKPVLAKQVLVLPLQARKRARLVNKTYALGSVAALALAGTFGVSQVALAGHVPALKRIHDPRHVTYSIHLRLCRTRDHGQLPDPSCTPGSIDPAVTQDDIHSTICRSGWTSTVRPPESQTEYAKYHVAYPAYDVPGSAKGEFDHLVPLDLGGSNDITNLWPEVGKIPNPKDKVEDALNHAVCDGRVSLAAAQRAIASDWRTAEARLGLSRPHPSPSPAPSRSAWCSASASYSAWYQDYDIYVNSNQPDKSVTATASNGASHRWHTDDTGYADVYLHADAGDTVKVTVGAASCSTTT